MRAIGRAGAAVRVTVVLVSVLLGAGTAGAAPGSETAAPPRTAGTVVRVTVLDGKARAAPTLRLSATALPAGAVTLVIVNRGATRHAVAIGGAGLAPRRTPVLAAGAKARITVMLAAGVYRVWDPVRGGPKSAKALTVRTAVSGGAGRSRPGPAPTPSAGTGGAAGPDSTWTTCIDPVTGEDHGPMDHPCEF
jgi:hypothetical protein